MVIAVSLVGVMQMIVHQIIDMVSMRNRFVTTAGAMRVRCIVSGTLVRGTTVGIGRIDFQNMLVVVPFVRMV
jgi:hypothetical protein